MIYAKIFDINPPLLSDYLQICDGTYDETDILLMEFQIMQSVDFQINQSHSYDLLSFSLNHSNWNA